MTSDVLRVVLVIALLAGVAAAEPTPWRRPEVTLRVGATFPMFLIYEIPGPWLGGALGWRLGDRLELVATASAGAFVADGTRRYVGTLGAGLRVWPLRRGLWLQLGVGATGFVERIGVVLPARRATATDVGGQLTGGAAIGVRVRGWELGVAWDHNLVPWDFYDTYAGTEAQPYRGTATAWIGRQL